MTLDSASAGFTIGDSVTQTLSSGVIMSGEISRWSDSDKILGLIHVGADDGNYHNFVASRQVTDGTAIATVSAVSEDNQISENEQNADFSTLGADFLDFTENNPFGDPENN